MEAKQENYFKKEENKLFSIRVTIDQNSEIYLKINNNESHTFVKQSLIFFFPLYIICKHNNCGCLLVGIHFFVTDVHHRVSVICGSIRLV